MNRRETERILAAIRQAREAAHRVALATIVRIRGSAYRREGTRILVRADGTYECLLSGGCLPYRTASGEPATVGVLVQATAGRCTNVVVGRTTR